MKRSTPLIDILFIAGSSLLLFFTFLGNIHLFDWDEINFAECAREMIVSNDYWHVQIDFKPFYEKPPLFIWFQVLSMKLFGVNEFAARFPNAVCGLVTLLTLYRIGVKHFHRSFAMLWVLCYMGSILPHFYFKSGIIDPWFNYFIFLSLYFLYRYLKQSSLQFIVAAGMLCGLAVFTKGPVAYLLLMASLFIHQVYSAYTKKSVREAFLPFLLPALLFTILSFSFLALWYAIDIWQRGPALFYDFIAYQVRLFSTEDAGHGGFPGYHVVVLLLGCFPASFIAFQALRNKTRFTYRISILYRLLFILGLVVLIVFSLVQSKIVHYSSLCYYPISFFAAVALSQLHRTKTFLPRSTQTAILTLFLLLSIVLFVLPIFPLSLVQLLLSKDPFAQANLNATLSWTPIAMVLAALYGIVAIILFVYGKNIRLHRFITSAYFGLTIAFLHLFFWFYLPNVERISQHSAIAFFHSLRNENAYVGVYKYKSYAPLFYGQVKPDLLFKNNSREDVLLNTSLSKPVYVVAKEPYKNELDSLGFECYGRINGFVFLLKNPAIKR